MKIDWHTCTCTVALHTQRYVILSLTNVEVKRHIKVVTTLSNPSDSEDTLYFPTVMSIVILIHFPPMTVKKKKIIMRSHFQIKMA